MKRLFLGGLMLTLIFLQATGTVIEKNNNGIVSSVKFSLQDKNEDIPNNASSFFVKVLNVRIEDTFKMRLAKKAKYGMSFELYTQFSQGLEVDGGFYSFRYKNGRMLAACGNYIPTDKINPTPSITEKEAIDIYANHIKEKEKNIRDNHIKLVITEDPNSKEAVLAYKVFFETSSITISEIGYIDAHTGDLIFTLPASLCYSTLGTFYTLYNSTKNARTEYMNGNYVLYDTTRGSGIHTYNWTGNSILEFTDANNIWTASELGSCQMALDVHWALQQIYDVLKNTYGHNSYDGNDGGINAYVQSAYNTQFVSDCNILLNTGYDVYGPMASVDIIAHEYGHAILYHTTLWNDNSNERRYLHEGFSDIWGLLFEHHITPNADIWKIGEDVMIGYDCERDFANPSNPYAFTKIASTYNYGLYNTGDEHVKGGIASHWFYRLANGGSGTNEKGDPYKVYPVGLDLAEDLFTHAVLNNSYLDNCSTYIQVRQAFVDAANDMDNPFLAMQVENAWYAVGVGTQPSQVILSGPTIPENSSVYEVQNLPSGYNVTWTYTPHSGTSLPSWAFIPNSPTTNQCTIDNFNKNYINGTLTATITNGATTITTLEKEIRSGDGFLATCSQPLGYIEPIHGNFENVENTSADFSDNAAFAVKKSSLGSYPVTITSPFFSNATITHTSISGLSWQHSGNTITLSYPANDNLDPVLVVTGKSSTDYRVYRFSIYSQLDIPLQLTALVQGRTVTLALTPDEATEKDYSLETLSRFVSQLSERKWDVTVTEATTGKTVYESHTKGASHEINAAEWASGIYVIKASIGNQMLTQKIFVN